MSSVVDPFWRVDSFKFTKGDMGLRQTYPYEASDFLNIAGMTLLPVSCAVIASSAYQPDQRQIKWVRKWRRPKWSLWESKTAAALEILSTLPIGFAKFKIKDSLTADLLYFAVICTSIANIRCIGTESVLWYWKLWSGFHFLSTSATCVLFFSLNPLSGCLLLPCVFWAAYHWIETMFIRN